MRFPTRSAYTLVELLIAMTLSLLLLLGIAELFHRVGGSMNETRSVMSASAHLNEAALLLRQDLAGIASSLATKPLRIAKGGTPDDKDGYLEIIEGPDHIFDPDHTHTEPCHPFVNEKDLLDKTVGDMDDIIAFTATNTVTPFRGLIRGKIVERESAEIIWFTRGNTLYRRIRLIDDVTRNENTEHPKSPVSTFSDLPDPEAGYFAIVNNDATSDGGPQRYDVVLRGGNWAWTTLLSHNDLARRARRFGHDGIGQNKLSGNTFPYPLYDAPYEGWRYLRMPTIEETDYWSGEGIQYWKTDSITSAPALPVTPTNEHPDLWNAPYFFPDLQERKSGSLNKCIKDLSDRNPRTGEDVVLTNVLSFDVKVWDSQTREFVDLGTEGTDWAGDGNQPKLPRTWDSWTREYGGALPPYPYALEAIRITIRCFDPASRIIKQVTVVHRF